MGEGNALVNLGDISRPATVLIEKISDAIGGIAKPWQIVRVAKAEADAQVIHAQTKIEITELEQRGLIRMVHEEGQKQENIENIAAKAILLLSEESKPEQIEKDWLTHFFDRSRLISDNEMQELWSGILAGQANNPGSFSKRTVNLVASLDKSDALLFTKFCSFVWANTVPFVLNYEETPEVYAKHGIDFSSLTHLDNLGLITFASFSGFIFKGIGKN